MLPIMEVIVFTHNRKDRNFTIKNINGSFESTKEQRRR